PELLLRPAGPDAGRRQAGRGRRRDRRPGPGPDPGGAERVAVLPRPAAGVVRGDHATVNGEPTAMSATAAPTRHRTPLPLAPHTPEPYIGPSKADVLAL